MPFQSNRSHHTPTSHLLLWISDRTRADAPCPETRSLLRFSDNAIARSILLTTSLVSWNPCLHVGIAERRLRILLREESATQMVEVIWPLSSSLTCRGESSSGRGVLPLRTYIEETLRRSRTSYSTLQVALYYLVLIKSFVPKTDFTCEQPADCPASRALMCGRRMFLAALILASKYLQDRNYSAKAWSKMSGLRVAEINANERTYLEKINWKLHIPETIFKRWTDLVLKYTPNAQPPSPGSGALTWKSLVPMLTPELDTVPVSYTPKRAKELSGHWQTSSPAASTPTKNQFAALGLESSDSTPLALPRVLEPRVDMGAPPTPALARQGPLPTPQLTPSSVASSTPAASVYGSVSRRPSMCSAMAMAQQAGFNRCTMEQFPNAPVAYPTSRRPSIASVSSRSSPESMVSDRSRSSRASSISSISTISSTAVAPSRAPCLAKQATCRNARLPMPSCNEEKEGGVSQPIIISDEDVEMAASPEMADFTINEKALHNPSKHTKFAPQSTTMSYAEKSRKRTRPRGGRRSDLHEEVRIMLEEAEEELMDVDDEDDMQASPSPAADYATRMLSRSNSTIHAKETQPPASISRRGSGRRPVQRHDGMGTKRSCCSTSGMSVSPAPLYGEVA